MSALTGATIDAGSIKCKCNVIFINRRAFQNHIRHSKKYKRNMCLMKLLVLNHFI